MRGLVIAAPRSGAGKTTVTLGLLAALAARGVAVRAAKIGPDYIDTAFHAAATGRPGLNLDSWAMPAALRDALLAEAATGAELLLAEGAMGLFDGIPGPEGQRGSAADLCARHGLPVLLVLDVGGQAQTAAAVLRGFATHDPAVRIAGVVLNRVGSPRHARLVEQAMAPLGIPVLGAIPKEAPPALPERHLGLVQAEEHPALAAALAALAEMAEAHLDLDGILAAAAPLRLHPGPPPVALRPPGQRIALARDAAFSFVYGHVLAGWRAAGAEILSFSPLADEAPPDFCDACWLSGGYPELHAGRLAAASRFRAGLSHFAATRPVHGECGGYMVLGVGLTDAAGQDHAMAGLLSHGTSFAKRRLHLGYRRARLLAEGPLGPAGQHLRGHEFHYATEVDPGRDTAFATLADGEGRDLGPAGGQRGRVSGSFFHMIAAEDASG
ncbi:cobyrinate a,c-diamide synthase [Falsiroseomonas sp.]|uniref:cobyrinate a,c-diamide synthase n=1 Tax=Falsiroseomonas sp. TaxID=2870721 RepID=UPI002733A429|nr:cobyrinate a,c-diamide synthase [Falsiroseomonas sp.]MDP3416531.1 cobyrinate a,c-diamide synthase [Falsiroseomonas sp.]